MPNEGSHVSAHSSDGTQTLIQLHLSEYQALAARLTNWITLQYSLWAVLVFYVALIGQVWLTFPPPSRFVLVWGSVGIFEIVALFWCNSQMEVYRYVDYIERELRPCLEGQVGNQPFWKYEQYIDKTRGRFVWWEWMLPFVCLLALTTAILWRRPWSCWDSWGLVITILVYILLFVGVASMVAFRRKIFSSRDGIAPVFYQGNFYEDYKTSMETGGKGWIVGRFMRDSRKTDALEIKYWKFDKGEDTKHTCKSLRTAVECTLILQGEIRGEIKGEKVILKAGSYVVIHPTVENNFPMEVLQDVVGLTIKSPSVGGDKRDCVTP
ncbi:MAG: hypothetical protein ACRD59_03455 [Candidatus Acidiferrales bacterium]